MAKKFEKRIIDSILNVIKKNQVYLTQKENLPQLAKLGYMYNSLWYCGRHASYMKVIEKNQCDDNPKYKIEMCDPENDVIENYIYDAWGMHVSNGYGPTWDEFSTILSEGKELSELDVKMLKPNKTFDEWVEVLTNEEYEYSSLYPNKKEVADHLLCVIGNGYGLRNGFVIYEASGADQDLTDYGDWKNAKFRDDIQLVVNMVMEDEDVKNVMVFNTECKEKYEADELAKEIESFGMPWREYRKLTQKEQMVFMLKNKGMSDEEIDKMKSSDAFKELFAEEDEEVEVYRQYYPICSYSIISKLTAESDPSYIKAGIEICEDILAHKDEERPENVKFAEKFLKKFNK